MGQARKRQLAFCTTNDCNMRCAYCYTGNAKSNQLPKHINMRFARKAIDHYLRIFNDIEIRFYAIGEPTNNFAAMRDITAYARSIREDIRIELQSNGNFSKEVAEWVGANCSTVWLSIDGPPDIHDANRLRTDGASSSSIIVRNIKILRESRAIKIGGRATITPLNINRMNDVVDYFISLGIDFGYTKPSMKKQGKNGTAVGETINNIDIFEYATAYADAYEYALMRNFFIGSFICVNFDEPVSVYCKACHAMPYVTLDNYISVCDEAYLFRDGLSEFFIGRYDEYSDEIEWFPDRIDYLSRRNIANLIPCSKCEIRMHCAGQCLAASAFEGGSIFFVRKDVCASVKYLASRIGVNNGLYPCYFP